jgi:2',3'-cyclic-nucleotide 2'-phosphodiesterase/3'-nucleotidase
MGGTAQARHAAHCDPHPISSFINHSFTSNKQMKKNTCRLALLTSATLMAMALQSCGDRKPAEADLVLLYTTDVHGACLPFDFNRNAPAKTSLANVSTYVQQMRQEHPDGVMLFDTGDFLQGQPSMYYYNYVDTVNPHVVPLVANYLGYDAVGMGNHDVETGEAVYHDRLPGQFQMPWLCANAIDTRTADRSPMFQPYTVIERQGLKIAILGMITPNIGAWLPKNLWPNLEFEDMVECAQKWVPIIQQQEHPDLLIGLFHSGGDYTVGGSDVDTYKNENGGLPTAIKVPGFDLVLLGHDHMPRMGQVVNVAGDTVCYIDAQTQATKVGRADIHLTRTASGYKKQIVTSLIAMDTVAVDTVFAAQFAPQIAAVNAYVDRPLGTLTEPILSHDGMFGPSKFMDLIHNVQLWGTGADISFASVLSGNAKVDAGTLTMRQLFTLYRYENKLFTLEMTGDEVRRYLEYGYGQQFGIMTSADDHLLRFKPEEVDAEGVRRAQLYTPSFNYTSAAGIRYTVDVRKPIGERVTILSMSDGAAFDLEKTYRVAINSYQACGGGGFIPTGLGWDAETLAAHTVAATTKDVRQYVAEYIEQMGTVTPTCRGDWEVLPTDWWAKGAARDDAYLNPLQR